MELNYEEEVNKLEPPRDWWNPSEGKHKVHIIKVGDNYETTYKEESRVRRLFKIKVDGKEHSWGVTVGSTTMSLYGQLMRAGKIIGGLEGKNIDLIVQGDGKGRKYIVEQSLEVGAKAPPQIDGVED